MLLVINRSKMRKPKHDCSLCGGDGFVLIRVTSPEDSAFDEEPCECTIPPDPTDEHDEYHERYN